MDIIWVDKSMPTLVDFKVDTKRAYKGLYRDDMRSLKLSNGIRKS